MQVFNLVACVRAYPACFLQTKVMFRTTTLVNTFCTVLQYEYCKHLCLKGTSEQAANLMAFYMETWQGMQRETVEAIPVVETMFQEVLAVVLDPMSHIETLPALHSILFPVFNERDGYMLYYTKEQVSALAWALVGRVDRIITADTYVWLKKSTPASRPAAAQAELPSIQEIKQGLADIVTSMVSNKCDELTKVDSRDTQGVLAVGRDILDSLDMFDELAGCGGMSLARSAEDMQLERDMARAMALSMSDHAQASTVSQEDEQFDRDIARAMALSSAMARDMPDLDDDLALARALARRRFD